MKVFPIAESPIDQALGEITKIVGHTMVESIEEADIVLMYTESPLNVPELAEVYSPWRFFVILTSRIAHHEDPKIAGRPPNVLCYPTFGGGGEGTWMGELGMLIEDRVRFACAGAQQLGFVAHHVASERQHRMAQDGALRVLVVDDTPSELRRGMESVPPDFEVVGVSSYTDAVRELTDGLFDFVLTDLYMSPPKCFDYIEKIGRPIPYGFIIANMARAMGARVGIVTNANYHTDALSRELHGHGCPELLYDTYKDWAETLRHLREFRDIAIAQSSS